MIKFAKRSKSRALVTYVGAITILAVTALTTDIALGFLTNLPAYLHIQVANSASANTPISARQ